MDIENVYTRTAGIPHMSRQQAATMTSLILDHKFKNILELGFRHGVSSCFIAAALDANGGGHLTTIDRANAETIEPNIDKLLADLQLQSYVTRFYEPKSYIWRMMRMLEEDPKPRFDMCFIDGAHDWYTDGFAFFLADRLLVPGGLMIFDDIDWSYAKSPSLREADFVKKMPSDEREARQVRMVFELLVKPHGGYERFSEKGDWAFAWKKTSWRAIFSG